MFIVSANYRDRSSPYRWLIRPEGAPYEEARACKTVRASGIRFKRSDGYEEGFGCRVVARCESAQGEGFEPLTPPKSFTPLEFAYNEFVKLGTREPVRVCDALVLTEDGQIAAALPA